MEQLKIGDVVARKSYGEDVYFKVVEIVDDEGEDVTVILKGISDRIQADAPECDLVLVDEECICEHNKRMNAFISERYREKNEKESETSNDKNI